jgi:NTP pyrophosphatase (non-canonical NTP hydrolase)
VRRERDDYRAAYKRELDGRIAAERLTWARVKALTLGYLQAAHAERQEEWCPDQKPDLSFRGNEMAGDVGEACNVIKKLERERLGWRGSRATKEQLAEELADVVHTAILCAITAGIDLEAAAIEKFNSTSQKNGLAARISVLAEPAGEAGPRACDHSVSRSEGETICVTCGSHIATPSDASAIRGVGVPDDDVSELFVDAWAEADKAMRKFPQPNYVISKVAEEAGEVVKAAIHFAEGRDTAEHVAAEIKQAIAMLIRLYIEGDQVHGLPSIRSALAGAKP